MHFSYLLFFCVATPFYILQFPCSTRRTPYLRSILFFPSFLLVQLLYMGSIPQPAPPPVTHHHYYLPNIPLFSLHLLLYYPNIPTTATLYLPLPTCCDSPVLPKFSFTVFFLPHKRYSSSYVPSSPTTVHIHHPYYHLQTTILHYPLFTFTVPLPIVVLLL